jgi:serine/threonine-protein kinase
MAGETQLGRYQILEKLGQGAMGSVFRAKDPSLDRLVAIKTLGGALAIPEEHRAEYLERFQREARAAGRLSHPNIVAVHDLGVDEKTGAPFIVMEHVAGVTLATVLQENPKLPIPQALEIVEQVAAALEEAHRHGIIHRDIKPANVFLDARGRVKVGDFGIARLPDSELTETGIGLGTPGYMAPEVLRGAKADARADVFALGVLAYALVTGRRPFSADTRESLAIQILEHEPPTPSALRPEVPRAASDAVMHALAKAPEARTPSATEFLRELKQSATPIAPVGATMTTAPAGSVSRSRRGLLLLIAALLIAAALAGFALLQVPSREAEATPAPRPTPRPTPRPVTTTLAPKPESPLTITIPIPWPKKEPQPPKKGKGHGKGQDKKKEN